MLRSTLGRNTPSGALPVGEAWEVVDREPENSVVESGPLAGRTLRSLIEEFGSRLLGTACRPGRFPLLVKLIDAGDRLSLQVHPDEAACARLPGAEPKTEMWYVIAAKDGAKIFAGLNQKCAKQGFAASYASPEIEDYLQVHDSMPGDAYFIQAGTVHAIGAGNLLLEIQQNSDTTYRISDWGRVGPDGRRRELHVEQAMACIHFADRTSPKIPAASGAAAYNRKFQISKPNPHFHVEDLRLVDEWQGKSDNGSFQLFTPVNAELEIVPPEGAPVRVPVGRTCLVPACLAAVRLRAAVKEGETATVIRSSLPV